MNLRKGLATFMRIDRLLTLFLSSTLRKNFRPLKNGFTVAILMYHSISSQDDVRKHPYYKTNTRPEVFARQMQFLFENGYRVTSLQESLDLIKQQPDEPIIETYNQKLPESNFKRLVALTFDDGFRDFYETAWPILKSHGYTASVFLPTAFISNNRKKLFNRECLTWSEVRELSIAGIDFGGHTVSHLQLHCIDRLAAEQEVKNTKTAIEQALGLPVVHFSYPDAFPEHDKAFVAFIRTVLIHAGYRGAVTTRIGTAAAGDDPYTLKRLPVNSEDDEELFRAKLEGAYDWLAWPQRLSKKLRGRAGS